MWGRAAAVGCGAEGQCVRMGCVTPLLADVLSALPQGSKYGGKASLLGFSPLQHILPLVLCWKGRCQHHGYALEPLGSGFYRPALSPSCSTLGDMLLGLMASIFPMSWQGGKAQPQLVALVGNGANLEGNRANLEEIGVLQGRGVSPRQLPMVLHLPEPSDGFLGDAWSHWGTVGCSGKPPRVPLSLCLGHANIWQCYRGTWRVRPRQQHIRARMGTTAAPNLRAMLESPPKRSLKWVVFRVCPQPPLSITPQGSR